MPATQLPGHRLRWPGGSPFDTALVAALMASCLGGVAAELSAAPDPYPAAAGAYALAVLTPLPLLARRRAPIAAQAVVIVCLAVYHLAGYPGFAPALCLFAAVYACAAYQRPPWGWLAGIVGVLCADLIPTLPRHPVSWSSYAVTGPAAGIATMVIIGLVARQRRLDAEQRLRQAAATAEAQLARRMAAERLTIARELHDVLAHTISVIAVQSGAALDALDADVEAAREAMRTVRTVARRAMPDLRGALALLRATGDAELPPQPRLAQLPELADSFRGSGIRADVTVADNLPETTPYVELAAYRIVQEALTNVVRHAHTRTASVHVHHADGDLVVEVVDDGVGFGDTPNHGFGITGMRERAALVGGSVQISTGPTGRGTALTARLPLGAS
jgi:signal transduction histidine kinase